MVVTFICFKEHLSFKDAVLVWAAITKYSRLKGSNNINVFLVALKAEVQDQGADKVGAW